MAALDRHSPQLAGRYRLVGDSGFGPWLRLPNPGPVCGRALLREFEMKRERQPIFVERRPNTQEFNIRFALVSGKPLLPAENRRMREHAPA